MKMRDVYPFSQDIPVPALTCALYAETGKFGLCVTKARCAELNAPATLFAVPSAGEDGLICVNVKKWRD